MNWNRFRRFSSSSSLCVCSCNTDFYHTGELFRGWGEKCVPLQQPPTIKNGRVVYSNAPCSCFYYCVVDVVFCCINFYSLRKNSFLLSIEFVFDGKASVVESTKLSANADAIRETLWTGAHKVLCFRLRHKASWHVSWYNSFNAAAYRFNCVCLSIESHFFFTVYLNICFLMLLCVCLCLPFISQLEG